MRLAVAGAAEGEQPKGIVVVVAAAAAVGPVMLEGQHTLAAAACCLAGRRTGSKAAVHATWLAEGRRLMMLRTVSRARAMVMAKLLRGERVVGSCGCERHGRVLWTVSRFHGLGGRSQVEVGIEIETESVDRQGMFI